MSRLTATGARIVSSPRQFAIAVGVALAATALGIGLAFALGVGRQPQVPEPPMSAIARPETQPPASVEPIPTATAVPTPEPTPAPEPIATPTPAPTPEPMGTPTGIAVVNADALRLRVSPARDAGLRATLGRGDYVLVTSDRAEADGYAWTRVMDMGGRIGWVATGDGTDEWLTDAGPPTLPAAELSFSSISDVRPPAELPMLTVLEDGTVILADFLSDRQGFVVRRLTSEAHERFRSEVLTSPFLAQAGTYEPVLRPDTGHQAPGHGYLIYTFTVGPGPDAVVVKSIGWFGDDEEEAFYLPSPERKALDALGRGLMSFRELAADDEWADAEARPYVASDFLLWVGPGPPIADAAPGDGSLPAVDLGIGALDAFGVPTGRGRCGSIGLAGALAIVWQLRVAGVEAPAAGSTWTSIALDGSSTEIFLTPRTPAGTPKCEDLFFAY